MRVVRVEVLSIGLPFVLPVTTAKRVLVARDCTLLRVVTDQGLVGRGEASPVPGFGRESSAQARAALVAAAGDLVGMDVQQGLSREPPRSRSARGAIETALLDLQAKQQGIALCERLSPGSGSGVGRIPCNVLIAGEAPEAVACMASEAKARGFESFKLKVGACDLARDLARVAALRESVGARSSIRLDANQGYRERDALLALEAFAAYGIEYLEQPVEAADIDAMASLRRKSKVPLAADESAIGLEDVRQVIAAEAADVIVIKPSAAGGPLPSLQIADEARRAGLDLVVTSLLDSAIGVTAALHVAAAIAHRGPLRACGLATSALFSTDVAPLNAPVGGALEVPRIAGLGVEEDADVVSKCLTQPIVEIA